MYKIYLHFRILLCVFVSLFIVAVSQVGWAQATTASLQVSVSDSSGARIPAAQANILNVGTGSTQTATTDASGVVTFLRLAVGQYKLTVDKQGFSQYVQAGIALTVGQPASANVVLQIGAVSNKVTVTSQVPLVDTRSSGSNTLVGERQVVDIPLNGRLAQSLIQTAPGAVSMDRYDGVLIHGQGGIYPGESDDAINGTQSDSLNYQLDGVTHNDTYLNAALPFPNPDAIQEFALQSSNFSAEYGNAAGGVINIVSKSGTNQFHGDAFEFYRDQFMNANNYFSKSRDILHRNQYGGTLGGPILRNKLFFFGSYQGTKNKQASGAEIEQTPNAAERTGDFSDLLTQNPPTQLVNPVTGVPYPGNILPPPDTFVTNFLKYVPLPNGPNDQLTFQSALNVSTDNQYLAKINYSGGKNQLTGSYFWTKYIQPAFVDMTNLLAAAGGSQVRIQTLSLNHTYVQSPTLLFNTTYGWVQQVGGSTSGAPFSLGSLGANLASGTVPEIYIEMVTPGFNVVTGHLGQFNRGDWVIREDVTKVAGRHELHFGGEALHLYDQLTNEFLQSGFAEFYNGTGNALANFVLDSAAFFEQGGGQYAHIVGTQYGFWAQDNWRATDALTINAGLRWDPWLPFSDSEGRTICFDPGEQSTRYPNAPNGMLFGGSNHDAGCPSAGSDRYLPQFGPRVGFAYRLNQDGTRSLRGGYGVYYNNQPTTNYNAAATTAPFAPVFVFSDVSYGNPYGSQGLPNPFPAQYGPKLPGPSATFTLPVAIGGANPINYRPPTYNSYNLILEQQLGKTSVARLAYVGNNGNHLLGYGIKQEVNAAVYIPGQSTEANTQQRRPYQNFTTVLLNNSNGISNYNALQASLEKRTNNGLTLTANYTWSKSMDDIAEYSNGQQTDPYDRHFDYGPTAGDSTNNFKLTEVWLLPVPHSHGGLVERLAGGWEITSFVTWQSGEPFTVTSGVDNSFSGVNHDHADYLGGPIQIHGGRSHTAQAAHWFNTSQFVPNAIGTFGTASRNQVRGPRYFNTDAAAMKNTRIAGNLNLQLRGEAFNVFNNVNFANPNSTVSSGTRFGTITGADAARVMQLSAKIVF